MDGTVIDAAAQFAASQEPAGQTGSEETTSQQVESSTNDGGGESDTKPQDVKVPDKSAKEIARMARALQNLQEENARLKADGASKSESKQSNAKAETLDSGVANHPALKGLQVDADDGTVLYHGAWVTPEFVIAQAEQMSKIEKLAALVEGRQAEEETAKQRANVERVQDQLEKAVNTTIAEMRSAAFPQIKGTEASEIDDYLSTKADALISDRIIELRNDGEFTPEKLQAAVSESIQEAFEKAQKLFGMFGQRQFDKNREYAETHKVKSGGQPAIPAPADFRSMTKTDRSKVIAELSRRAAGS